MKGDPFYESQENHNLIGVANIFLEALFYDVKLDYHVPIISQQGEVRANHSTARGRANHRRAQLGSEPITAQLGVRASHNPARGRVRAQLGRSQSQQFCKEPITVETAEPTTAVFWRPAVAFAGSQSQPSFVKPILPEPYLFFGYSPPLYSDSSGYHIVLVQCSERSHPVSDCLDFSTHSVLSQNSVLLLPTGGRSAPHRAVCHSLVQYSHNTH